MLYRYEVQKPYAKGVIEVEIPNYIARKTMFKQLGVKVTDEGKVTITGGDHIDLLIKMAENAGKHVKSIDIELDGGAKITSFEQLLDSPYCDKIVEEISGIVLQGVSLGESTGRS